MFHVEICCNLLQFMDLTLNINFYKIMLVEIRILLVIWLSLDDKHEETVANILQLWFCDVSFTFGFILAVFVHCDFNVVMIIILVPQRYLILKISIKLSSIWDKFELFTKFQSFIPQTGAILLMLCIFWNFSFSLTWKF